MPGLSTRPLPLPLHLPTDDGVAVMDYAPNPPERGATARHVEATPLCPLPQCRDNRDGADVGISGTGGDAREIDRTGGAVRGKSYQRTEEGEEEGGEVPPLGGTGQHDRTDGGGPVQDRVDDWDDVVGQRSGPNAVLSILAREVRFLGLGPVVIIGRSRP